MKAAIINKTGGPEVIELKDIVLEKFLKYFYSSILQNNLNYVFPYILL